ncbi:entericidin A/B family lipoprotein [Jannaschia seohaensis]|uniref:Predicted small secreted protein n=1 Tax=Jannaschia seohaensis TaxID=475081 RepID=A0A2Y9A5B1_9RHOB|nr:entericidin A/B family lipoprotein [Jannaschia seohaensis]PWJ22360.1 putative small secreted protein [Jannaschia seohaensis]SSA38638.1 Predicted small secreted protein [Jannaschia seohaensis]
MRLWIICAAAMTLLTACETAKGIGKDVQTLGREIEEAAR